jgi:myosin heavy subunit
MLNSQENQAEGPVF